MVCRLCWYTAEKYLRDLKGREEFPPRILEGIEALADFLVSEARTIERGTESARRQAKEEVPGDRIKDAPALARELRWRARHAAGYSSDDDSRSSRKIKTPASNGEVNMIGGKRKRSVADSVEESSDLFRNFKRRSWDWEQERPTERDSRIARAPKPRSQDESQEWMQAWVDGTEGVAEGDDGDEAQVGRRRDVIVKVRRTAKGIERQRVERVLEEWVWTGAGSAISSPGIPTKTELEDVVMTEGSPSGVARPESVAEVAMDPVANARTSTENPRPAHDAPNGNGMTEVAVESR